MQVKKITQLGSSSAKSAVGPAPKQTPRAQPKGLKARYQPLGVNEPMGQIGGDDEAEDAEMDDAPTPADLKSSKKDKKRKQKEAKELDAATRDVTRKGKRKHTASEDDAAAMSEQLREEAKSAIKSKKQKTARVGSPDLGSEPTSTSTKKQTRVAPPVPSSNPVATPTPTSSKKPKKSKAEALPILRKEASTGTPRQTAVPIPAIPHSSPSRSPAPTPASQPPASPSQAKSEKRAKKRKVKDSKKETPVLPPRTGSSSD